MTEVESQLWVCLSCKNENNQDVVYFWKTQIFKEISAEVRKKKHGEGHPAKRRALDGHPGNAAHYRENGDHSSAEFVGTKIRARILLPWATVFDFCTNWTVTQVSLCFLFVRFHFHISPVLSRHTLSLLPL